MARISIEELYRGEGGGAKYGVGGIMGAVMQEVLLHGVPKEYDERTYIELLIVKHTLKAAEQMKTEGDFVSEMTDAEPPSCYAEVWNENPGRTLVRQCDARRKERGEGWPPMEPGQADPTGRRRTGTAALGEGERGAAAVIINLRLR